MKQSDARSQPWASGPLEILVHGLGLLKQNSSVARRLALISIDNAVELAIKTFLALPRRVNGLVIPRKELTEISESFPALLDALEKYAQEKLDGVDLGSIEWYHRLRNQLYHQGYGLSVEQDKVEIYAELASSLLKNLFGAPPPIPREAAAERLGRFIELWTRLETALGYVASEHSMTERRPNTIIEATKVLGDVVPSEHRRQIEELRLVRNEVVHGAVDHRKVLTDETIKTLENLVETYEELSGMAEAKRYVSQ